MRNKCRLLRGYFTSICSPVRRGVGGAAHAACCGQVSAGDDNSCMRSRQQSSNDHEAPLPPAPVTCAFGEMGFFGGWGIRSLSQREIT